MKAFISYSHHDEKALGRLHKHLAMLRREELLEEWFDREILAGGNLNDVIRQNLEDSDLFFALISPDFLASDYCYEKEMTFALERHAEGTMQVIPIILEPCEWRASPLGDLKAIPKDGQPVSLWTNENVAYLDVVTEIRRVIQAPRSRTEKKTPVMPRGAEPARRYRIKTDFDRIDRDDFRRKSFGIIRDYFQASIDELNRIGDPIRARYEAMGEDAFTCTILNKAARRGGEANITVHEHGMLSDISYSYTHRASPNTANGFIHVEANEYELFLKLDRFSGGRNDDPQLSPEEAAHALWTDFLSKAGISYD